jgi:hypothetical protein
MSLTRPGLLAGLDLAKKAGGFFEQKTDSQPHS